MKKLAILFVLALSASLFAGCASKSQQKSDESPAEQAQGTEDVEGEVTETVSETPEGEVVEEQGEVVAEQPEDAQ